MRNSFRFLIGFAFWLCCGVGQAQPANFMIGELTFERPASWKWIETVNENEKARLYIFDAGLKEKAIVSFESVKGEAVPSFVDKWKEPYLSQGAPPEVHLETNTVNHLRTVTVDIYGTKVVNKQPLANQATHGIVIDVKGEQIGARILGARVLVDKLTPVFAGMIKEALKPEE